jgi:hypothetical protein
MNQIPAALLEPPAPAPSASEPPGHAPDTPFATVLDDHQARTAVAEGHRRADESPAEDSALAALLGGVLLPADTAPAIAAAGSAEPEPVGGRVLTTGFAGGTPPGARTRVSDPGTCILTATRPIGVPADAAALPLRPPVPSDVAAPAAPATAPSPSLPIGPGSADAEGRGDGLGAVAAELPAVARATRLADVLQAATARPATPGEPSTTPSPATVAGAAGRVPGGADGERPAQAATSAIPATSTASPATPATPAPASAAADTPLPVRAVGLEHAVETVRLALRHSAERGITHARISLTPRELGSIEVHLRQTADGLVARVVAEHASAAQQLQQAGAELRRQLESQGLTLLRLDIGASGDEAAGRRGAAFDTAAAFSDDDRRRDGVDPLAPLDGAAGPDTDPATTTTLQLPNGALVDVLA